MSLKLNDIIIVRNQTILPIHEMDSCFRRNDKSFSIVPLSFPNFLCHSRAGGNPFLNGRYFTLFFMYAQYNHIICETQY